jgi:hypothetical protein
MEKIEKLKHTVVTCKKSDSDIFRFAVKNMEKINEIIDRLNEQEEKVEKVYVDPIKVDFTKEDISVPVEFKTREQVEEMFEDTTNGERDTDCVVSFIKKLLEEKYAEGFNEGVMRQCEAEAEFRKFFGDMFETQEDKSEDI